MILLLTKDLFFLPQVQNVASKLTLEVRCIPSVSSPRIDDIPNPSSVTVCLIDLSSTTNETLAADVLSLRSKFSSAKLIAFGPHVHEARLTHARQLGLDQVLTRGQFVRNMGELLA